ncbi:MAG: ribulose-phosphate 3-epimerase [Thermoplasmatota archaeon]
MVRLSPSILSADPYCFGEDIKRALSAGADMVHVDVMDGHFVPNITYGIPLVKGLGRHLEAEMDVHLMISDPDTYAPMFAEAGADTVTVHVEASKHLIRTLAAVSEAGAKAGVTLNPHTPISSLKWVLEHCDMVLVMSVNPGYPGQSFIPSSLDRIAELGSLMEEMGAVVPIEVDGGIGPDNAADVVGAGADIIVAGSAVFTANNRDIEGNIRRIKEAFRKGLSRRS